MRGEAVVPSRTLDSTNFYLLTDLRGTSHPGISVRLHVDYGMTVGELLSTPRIARLRPTWDTSISEETHLYTLMLHHGLPSLVVKVRVLPRWRGVTIIGGAPSNRGELIQFFDLVLRTQSWLNAGGPARGIAPPQWPFEQLTDRLPRGDPCGYLIDMYSDLTRYLREMGLNVDIMPILGDLERARQSLGLDRRVWPYIVDEPTMIYDLPVMET
jgi:hypothetical protein